MRSQKHVLIDCSITYSYIFLFQFYLHNGISYASYYTELGKQKLKYTTATCKSTKATAAFDEVKPQESLQSTVTLLWGLKEFFLNCVIHEELLIS